MPQPTSCSVHWITLLLCWSSWLAGALAARNVTIAASDTSLDYQPDAAWQVRTGQSGTIGDGTAKVTTQNGASVSLTFTGTAIYFQTVRATTHGVATINLDGTDFKIDSSGKATSLDTGVVWGIVSLKDGEHKITVTQTETTGIELSVNAFIYTSSSDSPGSTPGSSPPAFSPSNRDFARNMALLAIGAAAMLVCLALAVHLYRKRKHQSEQNPGASDSTLERAISGSDSMRKTYLVSEHSLTSVKQGPQEPYRPPQEWLVERPPTVTHHGGQAYSTETVDMGDPEAIRRARMLHPLVTSTEQYRTGPETGSSAASSRRMLPSANPSAYASAATMRTLAAPWDEPINQGGPAAEFFYRPDHASLTRPREQLLQGPSRPLGPDLENNLDPLEKVEMTRRLREASSLDSSRLPAGFTVIRAASPPPAYRERLTQHGGSSSSSSRRSGTSVFRGAMFKGAETL